MNSETRSELLKHANGVYKHNARHIKTTTEWISVQEKLDSIDTTDLPKKADKITTPVEDNFIRTLGDINIIKISLIII